MFKGRQVKNIFLTQTDLVNVITWRTPTSGPVPVEYRFYRDAAHTNLAGVVSGTGKLKFEDHNRKKNKTYTYYIVSVNQNGTLSAVGTVVISH